MNKAPETFIIGAPLFEGGGYYHFHVFWYGLDEDGVVERFVWALTDTSIQNDETTDDEEDENFNPALDASTLAIGHWTTKTDSVFNFTIDQQLGTSVDMTLHMVAVDDYGAFDRTPARLYFFSNTLGNPSIRFFRVQGGDTILVPSTRPDTVGFGFPYEVYWAGSSPNVRGYTAAALAKVDTVFPYNDGLFGYKWRLTGEQGADCQDNLEDCWHPRRFNEATNDSFSFFGAGTSLKFENNGSGTSPFRKRLPSGVVSMEVNSIDIAGVEVGSFERPFKFIVNFDPQTRLLNGETDWAHPEDPQVYPYYTLMNDPTRTRYPFLDGDRIPDRTYVVYKALARDDPRDGKLDENFKIGLTGFVQGVRSNFLGGTFSFATDASVLDVSPTWEAACDTCWYADTLGFLTGPSTRFTLNMQAVDEHGRRDGSPARASFDVGYPPCLQCIEVLPKNSSTSAYTPALACVDDPATHPCFQTETQLRVTQGGGGANDLQMIQTAFMLVNKQTYFVQITDNATGQAEANYVLPANIYNMSVLLHGKDDPREAWARALNRTLGWKYEIGYECDPFNQIRDGGGADDIKEATWGEPNDGIGLKVDPSSGLWRLTVRVVVPTQLFLGEATYRLLLGAVYAGNDPVITEAIFKATTKQFGSGQIQAVTLDQTACGIKPLSRPGTYTYFRQVRPPVAELPLGTTWRDCSLSLPGIKADWSLSRGAMASNGGVPFVKRFRLVVVTNTGDFSCSAP